MKLWEVTKALTMRSLESKFRLYEQRSSTCGKKAKREAARCVVEDDQRQSLSGFMDSDQSVCILSVCFFLFVSTMAIS